VLPIPTAVVAPSLPLWGCDGGAGVGGGGARGGPQQAVWRGAAVLRRLWPPSPCRGAAPCGLCLVAGGMAGAAAAGLRRMPCSRWGPAVGGGLQSGAALIDARLDVGSLPPRSFSPTVSGCRLDQQRFGPSCVLLKRVPQGRTESWGIILAPILGHECPAAV
jgi:hypothetical protein